MYMIISVKLTVWHEKISLLWNFWPFFENGTGIENRGVEILNLKTIKIKGETSYEFS